jgi:hypothetical protein
MVSGQHLLKKRYPNLKDKHRVDTVHAYVKIYEWTFKTCIFKADFILDEYKIVNGTQCFHLVWKKE